LTTTHHPPPNPTAHPPRPTPQQDQPRQAHPQDQQQPARQHQAQKSLTTKTHTHPDTPRKAHPRKCDHQRIYHSTNTTTKRCSRPLCSSQQTTRNPSHNDTHQTPTPSEDDMSRCTSQEKPRPQVPNHPARSREPPGRSLRTQQCARHPLHPAPAFHPANQSTDKTTVK
jgi:hypothetical protein